MPRSVSPARKRASSLNLVRLVVLADELRAAQRALAADFNNHQLGWKVLDATVAYDTLRERIDLEWR